jgi:hypothetical protein
MEAKTETTEGEVALETDEETSSEETTQDAAATDEAESEEDAGEEAAEEQPADALKKGDVKGLSEEAQAAVNRRIGKVVAREKQAIERADAAESELKAVQEKLEGGLPELANRLGLTADLLNKSEAETVERFTKLKGQRTWCRKHANGYEGKGEGDPSVDADTIRDRLVEIEDAMDEVGPKAREILARTERQARDIWAAGRAALKNKGTGKAEPKGESERKPLTKPPKLPGAGAGAPKAPVSARKGKSSFDAGEFKRDGGGKSALEKQFEKLYG